MKFSRYDFETYFVSAGHAGHSNPESLQDSDRWHAIFISLILPDLIF